ncbi:YgaP family membrane protein [Marinomonas transparens]|uniref:DUF2892 domain-containing protein n=1 Tax=Marinomonas transparens TaxID=2795388 RepID=A0A934JQ16_9GAMM|nr:DUF2892 domain-containing protein [Marinomonas transparens]MBJ7536121.1 DUF2892 domain-containing protein [Marinomonas transparens]
MKSNIGKTDRTIRIILGVAIIAIGAYSNSWWGALGVILLLTGVIKVCPAYLPFGISTCKK